MNLAILVTQNILGRDEGRNYHVIGHLVGLHLYVLCTTSLRELLGMLMTYARGLLDVVAYETTSYGYDLLAMSFNLRLQETCEEDQARIYMVNTVEISKKDKEIE